MVVNEDAGLTESHAVAATFNVLLVPEWPRLSDPERATPVPGCHSVKSPIHTPAIKLPVVEGVIGMETASDGKGIARAGFNVPWVPAPIVQSELLLLSELPFR